MTTNKGAQQLTCDMSNGGWTLIFDNTLKSNHNGITFTDPCPCSSSGSMNGGSGAHTSSGWKLGVTNCQGQNSGSGGTPGGVKFAFKAQLDSTTPNIGTSGSPHTLTLAHLHEQPPREATIWRLGTSSCVDAFRSLNSRHGS